MEDSNNYATKYLKYNTYLPFFELLSNIEEIEYEEMLFFRDYFYEDITDFIRKHLKKEITLDDDLIGFHFGNYNGHDLRVYLNAKEEFLDLIHTLRNRAQDMEEYQEYNKNIRGEVIE